MISEIVPRWEWRAFGDAVADAARRMAVLEPEAVQESDEVYVLSDRGGDTVKVREGMFANMEGPVKDIADRDSQAPKVKVVLTIWGRPVEVDLDYWQVDRV